eukprot:gb/GECH01011145.1/.p1 GENE.gb/GECH01011145.1/~~gb/GECH01011145.1/.p1  ORF type:complete len:233 (+),score=75.16 gb/GECH01011145.1/:1-699(+)
MRSLSYSTRPLSSSSSMMARPSFRSHNASTITRGPQQGHQLASSRLINPQFRSMASSKKGSSSGVEVKRPKGRDVSSQPSVWDNPFGNFDDMRRKMLSDFFRPFGQDEFSMAPFRSMESVFPSMDISEDEKAFHVTAELPGVNKDDLKVTFKQDTLSISGEKKTRKEEKDDKEGRHYHVVESSSGSFSRSYRFEPDVVDSNQIKAKFEDGVLSMTLPKTQEAAAKGHEIEIE